MQHDAMTDRIVSGTRYLASEFSATRAEFRTDNQPDGDELLDGLLSHGYAIEHNGRVAASRVGLRMLDDRDTGGGA